MKKLPVLFVSALYWTSIIQAQSIAFNINAGTMGPGVGMNIGLTESLNVRFTAFRLPIHYSDRFTDASEGISVDINTNLNLGGASALLDWYPMETSFHFSIGAFYNNTSVSFEGRPASPYTFDDNKTFPPEKLGEIWGKLAYPMFCPYLGFGFGDALDRSITILIDVGVFYTGSPLVKLEGNGMIAPTARQTPTINSAFESFQYLPFLNIGVAVKL